MRQVYVFAAQLQNILPSFNVEAVELSEGKDIKHVCCNRSPGLRGCFRWHSSVVISLKEVQHPASFWQIQPCRLHAGNVHSLKKRHQLPQSTYLFPIYLVSTRFSEISPIWLYFGRAVHIGCHKFDVLVRSSKAGCCYLSRCFITRVSQSTIHNWYTGPWPMWGCEGHRVNNVENHFLSAVTLLVLNWSY